MEDIQIGVLEANKKSYNEEEIRGVVQLQPSCGHVLISIEEDLKRLSPFIDDSSIYRVPKCLHEINHKAYAPQIISIGPFHHNNKDLMDTERYKLQSLKNFQDRLSMDKPLEFLIKTTQSWVYEARKYYAEPIKMNDEEFLKMMLLDGCFIVEFIKVQADNQGNNSTNFSLFYHGIIPTIYQELIKLENQIPFFVLQGLFDLIPKQSNETSLLKLLRFVPIYGFLNKYELPNALPRKPKHLVDVLSMYFLWGKNNQESSEKNMHLEKYALCSQASSMGKNNQKSSKEKVRLVKHSGGYDPYLQSAGSHPSLQSGGYDPYLQSAGSHPCLHSGGYDPYLQSAGSLPSLQSGGYDPYLQSAGSHPSLQSAGSHPSLQSAGSHPSSMGENNEGSSEKNSRKKNNFLRFFCFLMHLFRQKGNKKISEGRSFPPSISELQEAGVTIRKAENPICITNVSFKNGVLEIPPLYIDDSFEPILRNLLAFEHFSEETKKNIVHYVVFMDYLISTQKDVSLLVKAGIIINDIGGSDKEVSELFNNLCKGVNISSNSPKLNNISKDLRDYSNGWWNKSRASLKHDYFNTPWAFISFLAATILIVLTILQTIFSAITIFLPR